MVVGDSGVVVVVKVEWGWTVLVLVRSGTEDAIWKPHGSLTLTSTAVYSTSWGLESSKVRKRW